MVVFPGAKINIGLYVTGRRDDGYHNILTLFYPIGLSDILEAVPLSNGGNGMIRLSLSGIAIEGPEESNLVVKAYRLLNERFGLPGVEVFLHKCIPAGAGLGGGSSDGASMLLLMNRMFSLNLSGEELFSLALGLGSDCPFFLNPVPSFARGRGEELVRSMVSLKGLHLYLFHPLTGISTAQAYRHVKIAQPPVGFEQLEKLPVSGWPAVGGNAFEAYAFEQQPVIRQIKEKLYLSGALYASMTGSGSAVYGVFGQEPEIPADISGYLVWKEILTI